MKFQEKPIQAHIVECDDGSLILYQPDVTYFLAGEYGNPTRPSSIDVYKGDLPIKMSKDRNRADPVKITEPELIKFFKDCPSA